MAIKFSEDIVPLADYEAAEEEKAFMRAIVDGLNDLDNNRQVDLDTAKKRLGL